MLEAQIWGTHEVDKDKLISPLQEQLEAMVKDNNSKATQLAATARHHDEVPPTAVQNAMRRRAGAVHTVLAGDSKGNGAVR